MNTLYINRSTMLSLIIRFPIKTANVHVYLLCTFGCLHFVILSLRNLSIIGVYTVGQNEERTNTIGTQRKAKH